MSLTKVSYSLIRGAPVNVLDYGAIGNGIDDDTDAIKKAIAAAQSAAQAGNSGVFGPGVYTGTAPGIFFPSGVYRVASALTQDVAQALNYFWFTGESSIITLDPGVICFGGVGFNVKFEGLTFRGGACAISIKTNNTDTSRIDIVNCEFNNQTVACIRSNSNSASTLLNIYNCKLTRYASEVGNTGHIAKFESIDWINFFNCWITNESDCCIYNAGILNLYNCVGVPGGNMNTPVTGRWIDNYFSTVVDNFRFGGEGSGSCFVHNYAEMQDITPTAVVVKNCLYAYTGDYAIKFFKLPNQVIFTGNDGLIDTDGFYFDAALTQANFLSFAADGVFTHDGRFYGSQGAVGNQRTGYSVFIAKASQTNYGFAGVKDRLIVSDISGSSEQGGGWSVTTSGVNGPTYNNNPYGIQTATFTATTDNASFTYYFQTYLNPAVLVPNQIYTLSFQVDATTLASNQTVFISIGGTNQQFIVTLGNHICELSFVYLNSTGVASASFDSISYTVNNLNTGDVIVLGRFNLFNGLVRYGKETITLADTGAPIAFTSGNNYNGGYFVGDLVYNTSPASAGYIGNVCTVKGTTGTWNTFGVIS